MSSSIDRRDFVKIISLGTAAITVSSVLNGCISELESDSNPNIIIIFADDLGYGDLEVFGHPTINTPNLDRMAAEGQKWTNFYAAASVCTPSRAALLTGRLPIRNGMCSDVRRVLFPNSSGGLPPEEITIAKILKSKNYATACVGKWHLGHLPKYLPTNHGFDYYFGIPYSNDMDEVNGWNFEEVYNPKVEYFNVPLMENDKIIERPANQTTITKRYTEETIRFITKNKQKPFFIYLAHSMPHVPLFASEKFKNSSLRGLYGDVVEEIDWSVGQILSTLKKESIEKNTLVIFTSDNGPWLLFKDRGGSAGMLRDGKGTTWEGGMREPTIFWWPDKIKPGVVRTMGSTLDIFMTICNLVKIEVPKDRIMDGYNLEKVLFNEAESPREVMLFYRGEKLFAVRKGVYKAHFITQKAYGENARPEFHDPPLLFNLNNDPEERYNIADKYPEKINEILEIVKQHEANLIKGKNQLEGKLEE